MSSKPPSETTKYLTAAAAGDALATRQLTESVYAELRELAAKYLRREPAGHALRPTGLVHEAFLRLVNQEGVDWRGRTHFFAVAAQAMRRVLVDHARKQKREKRGGGRKRLTLDEGLIVCRNCEDDVLVVNDMLDRLAEIDPRQATIVELRFFGGLMMEEVATVLRIPERTVEREWKMARAWLRRRLSEDDDL